MERDDGTLQGDDGPRHLRSLADVQRVARQLLQDHDAGLRAEGRSLALLLEHALADLQRVLQHAREGALVGVPANLGAWPPAQAALYVEHHLELLVRLNPDDVHLVALQRRRPELFARAAVWLEVARWHWERDHPDGAAAGDGAPPVART
ncbi:hypothetical protein Tsedi_01968 [Tepidimonas sediminis]|uniref:Uncharacterized protein n=1 Tax=Tepidimonas sediminis TaxID=2588941 RepID=A0A554WL89_9BURK|nr:hypothetical protein [Tepidimonas sediminis]TSE24315.1 hypothetical protein Tsedi_01968 [Tepidimonas sediminis]